MTTTSIVVYSVVSAVAGFVLTLLARLMDRFIPDTTGKHPTPAVPDLNADGKPG